MPRLVFFSKLTREQQLKQPFSFIGDDCVESTECVDWNEIRSVLEIRERMHPCSFYDSSLKIHNAVLDYDTWQKIGFVLGFIINRDLENKRYLRGGHDWWFLKYPMIKSNTILQLTDTIVIFKIFIYEPPLTQTYSMSPTLNELKLSMVKRLWLPKEKCPRCDEIVESARKFIPRFYEADMHFTDKDLVFIEPDFFSYSFGLFRDKEAEEFLISKSKQFFLPTVIMTKRS
jgi:hypothetical protein